MRVYLSAATGIATGHVRLNVFQSNPTGHLIGGICCFPPRLLRLWPFVARTTILVDELGFHG